MALLRMHIDSLLRTGINNFGWNAILYESEAIGIKELPDLI